MRPISMYMLNVTELRRIFRLKVIICAELRTKIDRNKPKSVELFYAQSGLHVEKSGKARE